MNCRHCAQPLTWSFLDLGFSPPSNAYLSFENLSQPEVYFPLRIKVCTACWLVQTEDYAAAKDLFKDDYAYFSSTSTGWLNHAKQFADAITKKLKLDKNGFVVELASNDGYLLKNFVAMGIPCLGIEPTSSTANAARQLGVDVLEMFFCRSLGEQLAQQGRLADLIVGNNVYAHVPDINDFTQGLAAMLKPNGTVVLEFPHLMRLIQDVQFDTVYHEHFSYFSLYTVSKIFESAGLRVLDVEELETHGGSLRVYGCHISDARVATDAVQALLLREEANGLRDIGVYTSFQSRADRVKNELLAFLLEKKQEGLKVVAYGAAAKGNTLLNYAGIKPDLLPLVVDGALSKQGKYLPGSHIPIGRPDQLQGLNPDFVLVLPWNIAAEVMEQNADLLAGGTVFVAAVPKLRIL